MSKKEITLLLDETDIQNLNDMLEYALSENKDVIGFFVVRNIIRDATVKARLLENKAKLFPGTQIVYIPDHANGNIDHPDSQAGFVTAVCLNNDGNFCDYFYCRYWNKDGTLRTRCNSEGTRSLNLVIHDKYPQSKIDAAMLQIKEKENENNLSS